MERGGHSHKRPKHHSILARPSREHVKMSTVNICCPELQSKLFQPRGIANVSYNSMIRQKTWPSAPHLIRVVQPKNTETTILPTMSVISQNNSTVKQTMGHPAAVYYGKLRRGRLRPLCLAVVSGPTTEQCRGIRPHFHQKHPKAPTQRIPHKSI
ncbi:hypothetical protein AALO_G00130820 [Alosa alosa]|uniref:Uncharacterized protein n=1 Tax=Alosa alosa TaxID=278164 RepID=A0AAV6GMK0_9TELE|nr:hypothetical protein AALO_G00130820 [Alosa alosa]